MQSNFKPKYLKKANKSLDEHILSANIVKEQNDQYRRGIFKESLWQKILGLFRR